MATVTLRNLAKSFGAVDVIKGISLSIDQGEFVALVGPSGCGKSTLLRLIAGLEDVSGGEIDIDGHCVNHVPSKARDIAMVFQNYALYPHMTVEQNMGFSLRMRKLDKTRIRQRVADAAASLNLAHLLDRYPRELSGGQRQRVAMGRAIVREPRVFLFDEPLSNLDAKLRVQVRSELRQLHRRLGVTSIYVTHDQVEAMTMADRIVVLRDGHVEQVGSPVELYDNPVNTFVATFIGSPAMNLLGGVRRGTALHMSDGTEIAIGNARDVSEGAPLTIGIRPENVEIATIDDDGMAATLTATEMTGSETMVLAELGGKPITILTKDRVGLSPGSAIRVRMSTDKQLFFDADGRRLARA